ncbi:MAG: hypothetical protein K2I20_06585 [Clostridia bacterium]|nr:hypothetical protein [Clostridia bacterium]
MTGKSFVKKFSWIFIFTCVMLYLVGFYAVGFYVDSGQYLDKYDFENPVTAVYTGMRETLSYSRRGRYDLIYEYTAPDGTFYTGYSRVDYSKSEAEALIGEEVDLYIDGKGDGTLHDYTKDNRDLYLIFGIVFLVLGVATAVTAVVLYKRKPR